MHTNFNKSTYQNLDEVLFYNPTPNVRDICYSENHEEILSQTNNEIDNHRESLSNKNKLNRGDLTKISSREFSFYPTTHKKIFEPLNDNFSNSILAPKFNSRSKKIISDPILQDFGYRNTEYAHKFYNNETGLIFIILSVY